MNDPAGICNIFFSFNSVLYSADNGPPAPHLLRGQRRKSRTAKQRRGARFVGRFVGLIEFIQYFFNCAHCHSYKFRIRFGVVRDNHQCLV